MNIIYLNTQFVNCGAHAMGLNLWRVLKQSKKHNYRYLITESMSELISAVMEHQAQSIVVNHLNIAQPWYQSEAVRSAGLKQFAFLSHGTAYEGFDAYFLPDPDAARKGNIFPVGRPLPAFTTKDTKENPKVIIGSAGHLLPHKEFHNMVELIISQFDSAHIRFLIGRAELAPYELPDAEKCQKLVAECGKDITIEIIRQNKPLPELVDWLAEHDLNVYIYNEAAQGTNFPAIAPDAALAARRPIAVGDTTSTGTMRLFSRCDPSISVLHHSLKTILANGIAALAPVYERCSDVVVLSEVESIIEQFSA